MKGLLALLLLAPGIACATDSLCAFNAPCGGQITAGTAFINGDGATFNISGSDFAAEGGWRAEGGRFPNGAFEISPGEPFRLTWGENCDGGFFMSISVENGASTAVPGFVPDGACGAGTFSTMPITIAGAGVYKAGFSLDAAAAGPADCGGRAGAPVCDEYFHVIGTGIATMTLVPEVGLPGIFEVSSTNVSFGAPEPSMLSLLLLGFTGLAVLAWHRKRRARMS